MASRQHKLLRNKKGQFIVGTIPPSGRKQSKETRSKISINNARYWLGKKRDAETLKKMGKKREGYVPWNKGIKFNAISGDKHYAWKGGVTDINLKIRKSIEYKLWRTAVFERDNYTCIWGGKEHGNRLEADHIKSFSAYPELRFAIDNGRTLCRDCHRKTTNFGRRGGFR